MPNEYLQRKEIRKAVLEKFANSFHGNWQDKATPDWIVRDMVGQVEDKPELLYCVLFNMEFLEELVYNRGISRDRIMYMADNRHEAKAARELYEVKTMRTKKELGVKRTVERVVRKARKAFYEGKEMPKTNNLVVFGNPPYQQVNNKGGGTTHASPIYHLFVEAVIDNLNPRYLSFIIPSRWMAGGRGLDKHRTRMMSDRRLRIIKHFPGSFSVFEKGVEIKGGVNYFLWDREHQGKCCFNGKYRYLDEYSDQGIILVDGEASSILDKVKDIHKKDYISSSVLPQTPFGLVSSWDEWCSSEDSGAIKCYRKGMEVVWVNHGYKDAANVLPLWKVAISEANNGATNDDAEGKRRVIGKAFFIEPNAICTQSYIVVKCFQNKSEASNFASYMGTMFFRFMLGLHMAGQHVNTDKFSWVPDLGDYSKPVTDADLYKRFGLTPEEIAYIESKIKALDNGSGSSSAAA